jgi:hypothetical protein
MPKTVNIEPNWAGMRRWVLSVARTDMAAAVKVNASLGCEGVTQDELAAVVGDR